MVAVLSISLILLEWRADSTNNMQYRQSRRLQSLRTFIRRYAVLIVVVTVVVGVGISQLPRIFAVTPLSVIEAEAGQIAGSATKTVTTTASGGGAIRFGGTAATTAGSILFEDDFTGPAGSSFDTTKWHEYSACGYNSSAAYGDIKCGEDETLDGSGHLIIPATPTRGQSLMTGDNFKFVYGTMSAWIKTPAQVGYWPAFWSLNNNANGQNVIPVGEVDALEGYTTWNNVYHATAHNHTSNPATQRSAGDHRCAENLNINLSSAYNKYSAKIEPNKITFYFNDVQCGAAFVNDPAEGKAWAFGPTVTRGNWLILTLAVGGAGGQQLPATGPAQMLVDRVEVRSN